MTVKTPTPWTPLATFNIDELDEAIETLAVAKTVYGPTHVLFVHNPNGREMEYVVSVKETANA